jgi:ABC-type protease/lipase transport system fused ATPase/permease subunit
VVLFRNQPAEPERMPLPKPKASLDVSNISIVPPNGKSPILRGVNFTIAPGEAVGVIGPSGSGKSTLARALTSVWAPAGGDIRLDGAKLDQYDPRALGKYVGYLPQAVSLFEGTIAENIARLSDAPDAEMVVRAAKSAAAHDMILGLPDGYDTVVSTLGTQLSGGQIQRIGLARALYGDPVLLVLDEPNSALDNEGSLALNAAIKNIKDDGRAVVLMAHRPAAIKECDKLLVLYKGVQHKFGPTAEVLQQSVANFADIKPIMQGAP